MDTNIKFMVVLQKLVMTFNDNIGKNIESLGITPTEFAILAHLNEAEKEKTQKLAQIAFITSGTITHVVNKLVKQGIVTKCRDEKDKRIYWVSITQFGKQKYKKIFDEHMKHLNNVLSVFEEKEKLEFIEHVKYVGKKIEENNKTI